MGAVRQPHPVEKRIRRARAAYWAGLRDLAFAQETNTLIAVFNGAEAGLDTDGGRQPWSLVCDVHASVTACETLAMARSHASNPLGWCEHCMAERDAGRVLTDDEFNSYDKEGF